MGVGGLVREAEMKPRTSCLPSQTCSYLPCFINNQSSSSSFNAQFGDGDNVLKMPLES